MAPERIHDARRPIAHVDELAAYFAKAGKPRSDWRVGMEHEKIGVWVPDGTAVPFAGERGITQVFARLISNYGWSPIREDTQIIALARGGERITLEPGGQLELSGTPLVSGDEVAREITGHLEELRSASAPLRMAWLGIGFRPFGAREDIPWVPKGRYAVMREYLLRRGQLGHDMMKRTATVQANLDFADEGDLERKLRAAMSVTSIVTALFASSPLADGRDTGYASYRARAWLDTDPHRCGLLPFAFEKGESFSRYAEWALDVPMFFIYRGHYIPARGITFRRFLREGFQGERATMDDWELHISTLFPEARLKQYLELRGADSGPLPLVLALPMLWKGLLYSDDACERTIELTKHLSYAERLALRDEVPLAGLAASVRGVGTVRDAARELVTIARGGLMGLDAPESEIRALEPLADIVGSGVSRADEVRAAWAAAKGEMARLIEVLRY